MRIAWLTLALVLSGGAAHADRFSRGENLFKQQCVSCHKVGWGTPLPTAPGKIDLTGVTERLDPVALRRFLAEPAQQRPGTGCRHPGLPREPVDDLVRFLELRGGTQPGPEVVPPRSHLRDERRPSSSPAGRRATSTPTATAPPRGAR